MTPHTAIDRATAFRVGLTDMTESFTAPLDEIETEHESPPAAPRWVKALGVVLVVLFLAFIALHLTGNAPTHGMPIP
jgi:hypothetical protein